MSFLDNLENNLKSLESQEEGKESAERSRRARDAERANAQAAAPWAEAVSYTHLYCAETPSIAECQNLTCLHRG